VTVSRAAKRRITAVVIGAGHAGLAMSRCLAERSIDHVVLERGEVANSWKTERWDSLTLLTPNCSFSTTAFGKRSSASGPNLRPSLSHRPCCLRPPGAGCGVRNRPSYSR